MNNKWFTKSYNKLANINEDKQEQEDSTSKVTPIAPSIDENLAYIQEVFKDCSDLVVRDVIAEDGTRVVLTFFEGITKTDVLQEHVIRPFIHTLIKQDEAVKQIADKDLTLTSLTIEENLENVQEHLLNGDAALFINGKEKSIILSARSEERRSVEEPSTEASIRGPREGFTENIGTNLTLLRYRIKSPKLKILSYSIGTETKTNVKVAYMEGIIDEEVLKELKTRIDDIEIDGVLESGYIEELIEDSTYSPFPQVNNSERPDTVAAQLLEGQFAIFTDNTPFVLTGPVTFGTLMQASEDYYERYPIANLIRWLRYLFMLISLYLPGVYVAVITYHHDMIPTNLMFSIAAAREPIPFPGIIEVLIMEISFEALREAGIRLPKTIGQAVSILGALVIGTAAVEAGIVSAPMVIIVSLTGIASFTIPKFNLAISIRMLRFPIMIFASVLGIFGIMICTMLITLHLCKLRSFGMPYLSGFAPYNKNEQKDLLVRAPWWGMKFRPSTNARRGKRLKKGMKPAPPFTKEW